MYLTQITDYFQALLTITKMKKTNILSIAIVIALSSCSSGGDLCSIKSKELRWLLVEKIKPEEPLIASSMSYSIDSMGTNNNIQKRTKIFDVVKTGDGNSYQCNVLFSLWGNPEKTPIEKDSEGNLITRVIRYDSSFSLTYSISEKGEPIIRNISWVKAEPAFAAKRRVYQQEKLATVELLSQAAKDSKDGIDPSLRNYTHKIMGR